MEWLPCRNSRILEEQRQEVGCSHALTSCILKIPNLACIHDNLSALQAKDNVNKGVEEWNPKDDPHAQVLLRAV